RVLELDPSDGQLVVPAAKSLQRLYEQSGAVDLWVEALRIELKHESDASVRLTLLERIARLCEERLTDNEAAIAAWQQRVEEEPDDLTSLHALDRLYTESKRHADLVPVLQRAVELVEDADERRELMLRMATLQAEQLEDRT